MQKKSSVLNKLAVNRLCLNDRADSYRSIDLEYIRNYESKVFQDLHPTIKHDVVMFILGVYWKRLPRWLEQNGVKVPDDRSIKYSPSFFKLAESWDVLNNLLGDQSILDPFAGSGSLAQFIDMTIATSQITCSDIHYGSSISYSYLPEDNYREYVKLFSKLPTKYQLSASKINGYFFQDATDLSFPSNSFDYVITDPPYGVELEEGFETFNNSLDELIRVTTKGVLAIVPNTWLGEKVLNEKSSIEVLLPSLGKDDAIIPTSLVLFRLI